MFKFIDKYLQDYLQKIVFIEIKKEAHLVEEKFKMLKDIPVPLPIGEILGTLKDQANNEDISLASMARGMIYLLGLDSNFKYNRAYIDFLYTYDRDIENYIIYEGLKNAEQGEYFDALVYFKALLSINSDNINGLYNYARCCQDLAIKYDEQEKAKAFLKESLASFEILVEKYPDFAPAYYYLGFHYANQSLFKKAQLTWEECLKLKIDEEKREQVEYELEKMKDQVLYEEGYTYILNNQADLGIGKLEPLLDKYSDWWNLWFFVGLGYRQLKEYEKAIEFFERIIKMNPSQVDTLNELGLCYGAIGDYAKAEKYLNKALILKPEDHEILTNLGMVYMEIGNYNLAQEVFHKAIKINPMDEITKQCIDILNQIICSK